MDLHEFSEKLNFYIRPQSFPLAVKMLEKNSALPPKVKRPRKDLEKRIAVCQGISMARRYGWALAMGNEDINCPITRVVFGFERAGDN